MSEQNPHAASTGQARQPYPATLQRQALVEPLLGISNAELLRQVDVANDPLVQELAARYAAALGFLHKDTLHFTNKAA
jgi:hypothetical protein